MPEPEEEPATVAELAVMAVAGETVVAVGPVPVWQVVQPSHKKQIVVLAAGITRVRLILPPPSSTPQPPLAMVDPATPSLVPQLLFTNLYD